jgi:phage shock protein PspC (stress-responsive transcriptional regulator)
MVGGVCGGLGQYFDVNPLFYRVGFVVLTLLGGVGLLVYGAAVLVIPNEGEDESIASDILRNHRQRPIALVGLALVAIAGIVLLSHVPRHLHSDPFWIVVLVVGASLLWSQRGRTVGSAVVHAAPASGFADTATTTAPTAPTTPSTVAVQAPRKGWRWVRWTFATLGALILLVIVTAVAFAAPYLHLGDGIGNRSYEPALPAAVDTSYRLGIGNLNVDVSHVPFGPGPRTVHLDLGIGNMRVIVPPDVRVVTHGRVSWGDSEILGNERNGHDVDTDIGSPKPQLVLDAHVGIGHLEVTRART